MCLLFYSLAICTAFPWETSFELSKLSIISFLVFFFIVTAQVESGHKRANKGFWRFFKGKKNIHGLALGDHDVI